MTDRYADLRAALESGPQGDEWIWANYGPKTIGIGIAGGPAFLMVRPGDMIDRDEMESIVHGLVMSRRHACALLADYDRLRDALLWNAAALNECCKDCVQEASNITIASETKSFAEILDMADAALAQEQGGSDGSAPA